MPDGNNSPSRPSPVKVFELLKRLVFCILSKGVQDTQHVGVLKIPESERGDKDVTSVVRLRSLLKPVRSP